jgi:hypothetical protein
MRFSFHHDIAAPLAAIEDAILHDVTLTLLPAQSPIQYRAELLGHRDGGESVERYARFEARGLRRLTGLWLLPDAVTFTERTVWQRASHSASFVIDPEVIPWLHARVHCTVAYRLVRVQTAITRRVIEGDVQIDLPGVGRAIEAAVIRLLEMHFAAEGRFLSDFLAAGEAGAAAAGPSA